MLLITFRPLFIASLFIWLTEQHPGDIFSRVEFHMCLCLWYVETHVPKRIHSNVADFVFLSFLVSALSTNSLIPKLAQIIF